MKKNEAQNEIIFFNLKNKFFFLKQSLDRIEKSKHLITIETFNSTQSSL